MNAILSVWPGPGRGVPAASRAQSVKILVVNDHPLIRQAVAEILGGVAGGMHVLQADTVAGALAELAAHPDVALVLLDPALGGDGAGAVERIRAAQPGAQVAALCAPAGREAVLAVLARGALGFIPDRSPPGVLLNAVRLVLAGQVYLPPEILRTGDAAAVAAPAVRRGEAPALTRRQLEVLALLVQGMPNKLVCRALAMAEGTLKTHVATIYRELGVSNRAQAGYAMRRLGIRLPGPAGEAERAS